MSTLLAAPQVKLDPAPVDDPGETRLLINNIDWQGYLTLTGLFINKGPRVAYLDGAIELMTVGVGHETPKKVLARMVEALTEELDIPTRAVGSTTLKRDDIEKAAEPDESYYLANVARLGGQMEIDLAVVPPPDLVIEVEITSPLLDKLKLYAGLGVPELWRMDGRTLRVYLLQPDGTYAPSPQSRAFPFLPMAGFIGQLQAYDPAQETRWARAFRGWVREVVAPLYQT